MRSCACLIKAGICADIPYTVDPRTDAGGLALAVVGLRVIRRRGVKGDDGRQWCTANTSAGAASACALAWRRVGVDWCLSQCTDDSHDGR